MLAAIAILGHTLAAAAFLLLCVLLLTRWRGRRHGATLMLACLTSAAWASAIAYFTRHGMPVTLQGSLVEILRNATWCLFLLGLLNPSGQLAIPEKSGISRQAKTYAAIFALLILTTLLAYIGSGRIQLISGIVSGSFGKIVMALMGMLLIEQLFRNTSGKARWAIKFACLGIGSLFAYDFYLYVDALLFNKVDAEIWAARGIVNAIAVPLIAVSASRNPHGATSLAVSRRIVFHSVTFIGSGIYLILVTVAGYYLRFFGGEWGTVLQATLLFAAAILLIAVLFSGAFRSWLRVSISKHFYSYGYDYREEWLTFTRTLSVEGPELGERAIAAIAGLVESPQGVLLCRDESDRYVVTAEWNLSLKHEHEPADSALCNFLKNRQWVIDVQEYDRHPEKYAGLTIPAWVRAFRQARLIVPLIQNGDLFGFVVLAEPRSRIDLNWEVLDLLKVVGVQTASYLARQKSADALAVARQFEAFNRMSTFVVHDLKNLVSQLALLVANSERHKDSPEFQKDMLETIEHAVQKMRLLLQKFNRESNTEHGGHVSLERLLQQVVNLKSVGAPQPVLEPGKRDLFVSADAARLERVLGHLVQNAIEATPQDGKISVRLDEQGDEAVIEVIDTGPGMSDEFIRTRLFKPFESTKSSGMGIGVFETREYVQQIGGRLEVDSQPGAGTRFRVHLPLYRGVDEPVTDAA